VAEQLCLEVREALEHGRPVLADLLFAAEAPVGVGGLLALVVLVEALEERFQIVIVERFAHPLDN